MIGANFLKVVERISQAKQAGGVAQQIRLIAVSKTKTPQDIMEVYHLGARNFGENYAEQLEKKAKELPKDINWHFIGHLQSNKIKHILVSNLAYIQSVDRASLAEKLQKQLSKINQTVNIMIQVKTSEEETKSGIPMEEVHNLYQFIRENCSHLRFKGLMTIGKEGDLNVFAKMYELKEQLCKKYGLPEEQFELSMGMSNDFQTAIGHHATSVRVGSAIFGERTYK